ncbi:MAG: ABC transporter substrate-binding protein, partial [Bacillota bacterium]
DIRAIYNEVEKEVLSNYGVNIWKDLFPAQDTYPTKVWGYLWMVAIDDPTIDVINQKVWDYTLKTVPQIVMAPADQFDKAYDDFLAGLDELGVQKVEEFYTKKIQENLELWSM